MRFESTPACKAASARRSAIRSPAGSAQRLRGCDDSATTREDGSCRQTPEMWPGTRLVRRQFASADPSAWRLWRVSFPQVGRRKKKGTSRAGRGRNSWHRSQMLAKRGVLIQELKNRPMCGCADEIFPHDLGGFLAITMNFVAMIGVQVIVRHQACVPAAKR